MLNPDQIFSLVKPVMFGKSWQIFSSSLMMVAHRIISLFLLTIATSPATILFYVGYSLWLLVSPHPKTIFLLFSKGPFWQSVLTTSIKSAIRNYFLRNFYLHVLRDSPRQTLNPPLGEVHFTDSLFQTFNPFWLWSATLFNVARYRSLREKASLIILT